MSGYVDLDALWRVAALSAGFGVGVVALYALGVAALTTPEGETAGWGRRVVGGACLAVCLVVIGIGIWAMLDK